MQEFCDVIPPIDVIETYPDAREEMDGLFKNSIQLLSLDGNERYMLDYEAACLFFSRFKCHEE